MHRTTSAAVLAALGSLLAAALAYAAVVTDAWVFAVLPVVPTILLASLGLGATVLTRRVRSARSHGLIVLGGLLAVAGAVSAVGYFVLWGLQFDYVDAGRQVPAALQHWDDITFVGSALICVASVILATAVLARAWSHPSRPKSMSTNVEGPGTTLSTVRY